MKTGITVLEDELAPLTKLYKSFLYLLAIETPGIHPVELKTAFTNWHMHIDLSFSSAESSHVTFQTVTHAYR